MTPSERLEKARATLYAHIIGRASVDWKPLVDELESAVWEMAMERAATASRKRLENEGRYHKNYSDNEKYRGLAFYLADASEEVIRSLAKEPPK